MHRSWSHTLGAVGILLAFGGLATPTAAQGERQYLYVTNWGSHDVSGYVKDPLSGALSPVPGSPFATGMRPRPIAMDPSNRFLYVGNDALAIAAFRIDAATGSLAPIPGSPFANAGDIAFLLVDPGGDFLYVSDPLFEKIRGYRIDRTTGALTPVPGSPFPSVNNVAGLGMTPSGQFLYATTRNPLSEIYGYAVDAATGALTPLPGSPWTVAMDAQAFAVVVDPTGRFLYTAGLVSDTIFGFTIHPTSGALTPLAGSPVATANFPQFISRTPDGTFLYASATSGGHLWGYSTSSTTGAIAPLPGFPVWSEAVNGMDLAVDESGLLVYVATQNPDSVRAFSLNPGTGLLVPLAVPSPPAGTSPNRMAMTRFGSALQADLSLAKTDGVAFAVPGTAHSYTMTVTNHGPGAVTEVRLVDDVPAALLGPAFTPSTGSFDPVSGAWTGLGLAAGQNATLTLTGTIDPSAAGSLVNSATVSTLSGAVDPFLANNVATDADVLTPQADLNITKSDGVTLAAPGQGLTYVIAVGSAGPSLIPSAYVVDTFPAGLTAVTWVCTATPGSSCGAPAAGAGDINRNVDVAPGGTVTFTAQGTVAPGATGLLTNTASVLLPPAGPPDPHMGDNFAADVDNISLDVGELTHGYDQLRSLAALPGPVAREDLFWVSQKPRSSYEVLVDATSGDIGGAAGPIVERLGADGSAVIQTGSPVGSGPSRSLRLVNQGSTTIESHFVRVRSASCTTDCGPDDVYRVRFHETTLSGARFNNSGSQLSVVVLQNTTDAAIEAGIDFWDGAGALLAHVPVLLAGRQTLVLGTASVPALAGTSGSLTIAHDGRYGDLAGKTVSIEPSTGFSFDTPLLPRPR